MKFPTPISTNPHRWAGRDDAQDSLAPSCLLSPPCSTPRNLSPKSAGPSNVSVTSETPLVDTVMSAPSASSPACLHLSMADTLHACEHGLCSPRLSVSVRSHYRTPVPKCRGIASGHLLSALRSDILSPTLCDTSNLSLYVTPFYNLSCRKGSTFIQTKVAAINCGVLTSH